MIDIDKLLKEEDDDEYQALLELNIRIAGKVTADNKELSSVLSEVERNIYLICKIDIQVCNGGYDQYFYYEGHYASQTVDAIAKIGLTKLADNYADALCVFPDKATLEDESLRKSHMDSFTESQREKLDKLSDHYYEINDPVALFNYASRNRTEISV